MCGLPSLDAVAEGRTLQRRRPYTRRASRRVNTRNVAHDTRLDEGSRLLCAQHDGGDLWSVVHLVQREFGDGRTRTIHQRLQS